jgi:hypothetical protein
MKRTEAFGSRKRIQIENIKIKLKNTKEILKNYNNCKTPGKYKKIITIAKLNCINFFYLNNESLVLQMKIITAKF